MAKEPHGKARLSKDRKTLTITIGEKVTVYTVHDLCPDPKVASPAFRLTKPDGVSWDVSCNEWGASCTCGAFVFKNPDNTYCKHIVALQAVGLLPKGRHDNRQEETDQKPNSSGA